MILVNETIMEVQHVNNPKGGFFHIEQAGKEIARMTYVWASENKFIIDHTRVDPSQEGKGIGKLLVNAAVQFARQNNLKIVPLCPYAKHVLTKSDEFLDILS